MNRKSLALLLVAALLAMMIPSFALAAGTVTASLSSSDWKHSLTRLERSNGTEIATGIKISLDATEGILPRVYWTSSDESVAYMAAYSTDYATGKTETEIPAVVGVGVGTATITGKVYAQDDVQRFDVLATVTFNVTMEAIPATAVTFTKTAYKLYVNGGCTPLDDGITVSPDDSTYGPYDLLWSVSDPKIISVNKNGNVVAHKKGTADVIATVKGSNVSGKATVTVYEQGEDPDSAFKSIQFSTKEFEAPAGKYYYLDAYAYLTLDPDPGMVNDQLIWAVSNPQISSVDGNKYDCEVTINSNSKAGDTVVITATSKQNPAVTNSITVTVVDTVPYKKLSFKEKTLTVKKYGSTVYLSDLLTAEWEKGNYTDDDVYYTSSDPEIINVGKYDSKLKFNRPGTVTITARSARRPDEVFDTITVTLEKEKLTKIWFTNDAPKKMKYDRSFAVSKYINTEPYYYAEYYEEEIGWSTSDPQVAYVDYDYDDYSYTDQLMVIAAGVGKATITAFWKEDEAVVTTTPLELEVLPNPITEVKFAKSEYTVKKGEPLALKLGKDFKIKPREFSFDFTLSAVSSDPEVVSYSYYDSYIQTVYMNTGNIGTATVTLSFRNADGSVVAAAPITVTVKDEALTNMVFKKDAYTVNLSNGYDTKNLYLALTPADAFVDWSQVYAESSDPDVLRVEGVTSAGRVVVQPKQPGTATVTVTYRENPDLAPATTTVTVKPIAIKSVSFPSKYKKLAVSMLDVEAGSAYERQNEVEIYANIKPTDAYYEAKWETSDASVAYVAGECVSNGSDEDYYSISNGKLWANIVAVGPGTCKISVTVTDGTNTITKKISVTVKKAKVAKLTLNKTSATGYIIKDADNTLQLIATDSKTDLEVPVTWKSSNKKVATVNKYGLVKFVGAGKAKITATTKDGNKTAKTCTLTVKKLAVTSVTPAKKTLTMKVGQTQKLTATVKPAKAYNPALYFKSSKPKIVSVDQEGNVKALAVGKAVITIMAKDGTKKSGKVTITVKAATKNNDGIDVTDDILDLTIDGDLMDGLNDISDLDIGGDVMDLDGAITNVTIE